MILARLENDHKRGLTRAQLLLINGVIIMSKRLYRLGEWDVIGKNFFNELLGRCLTCCAVRSCFRKVGNDGFLWLMRYILRQLSTCAPGLLPAHVFSVERRIRKSFFLSNRALWLIRDWLDGAWPIRESFR